MALFKLLERSKPQEGLREALETLRSEFRDLQHQFGALQLQWETVVAHVDQQTKAVHRELGHVSRKKRELENNEPDIPEAQSPSTSEHRSQFRGGRHR